MRLRSKRKWQLNDLLSVQPAMIRLRPCVSLVPIKLASTGTEIHLGIVTVTNTCVWCQNIHKDRRATYLHHQQSWKRGYCTGKGSHLHTLVILVKTSCSRCDQHFESVSMLLEHLRTVFPLVRNAELGLDTVFGNDGSEATDDETSSRCAGAANSRHSEANVAHSVPLGFETRPEKVAVFSGLPDPAHFVPHHQSHEIEGSQREIRPSSSGRQRSGTSADARRSVVQAGHNC